MARLEVARFHQVTAVITGSALGLALGVALGVWSASAARAATVTIQGTDLGQGLEDQYSLVLSGQAAADTTITITVGSTSICEVAQAANMQGEPSIPVTVLKGSKSSAFFIQGISTGVCALTITPPAGSGITSGTGQVNVIPSGLQIVGLSSSYTTQSNLDLFSVELGLPPLTPTPGAGPTPTPPNKVRHVQMARLGGGGVPITACSSNPQVGMINDNPTACPPTPVLIPELGNQTQPGALWFDPQTNGTTTVSASAPGFQPPPPQAAQNVNVGATVMNVVGPDLGAGLETSYYLQISPAVSGGTTVHISVQQESTGICELALTPTACGSGDIWLPVPSSSAMFYIIGLQPDPCDLSLQADVSTVTPGSRSVNVVSPGLRLVSVPSAMVPGSSDAFDVDIGVPGQSYGTLAGPPQPVAACTGGILIYVCSSNPAAIDINNSNNCIEPLFLPGTSRVGPLTLYADHPSYPTTTCTSITASFQDPNQIICIALYPWACGVSKDVCVADKTITIAMPDALARGLEDQATLTLSAKATAGGIGITISVDNASQGACQVALQPTDVGSNSIYVTVPWGSRQVTFSVLGVPTAIPTCEVTSCDITAIPDPGTDTAVGHGHADLAYGGFRINLASSLSTAAASVSFTVDAGVADSCLIANNRLSDTQQAQAGGLWVEVCSDQPGVLLPSGGDLPPDNCNPPTNCQLKRILVNTYETPPNTLQLQVRGPTTKGHPVNITAIAPACEVPPQAQFQQGHVAVNVSQAVANITNLTLGSALEDQTTLTVSPAVAADTCFQVRVDPSASSTADACALAGNSTDAGTNSIQVTVPAKGKSASFYVLASPACTNDQSMICHLTGSVTTCSSQTATPSPTPLPDIPDFDGWVTIVEPALRIRNLPGNVITGSGAVPFDVETGVPYKKRSLNPVQAVRRDLPSVVTNLTSLPITVCSDNPAAGVVDGTSAYPTPTPTAGQTPTPTGSTQQCLTVSISPGESHTLYDKDTSPVTSALWFEPLSNSSTNVTAQVPSSVAAQGGPCFKQPNEQASQRVPVSVSQSAITVTCPETEIGSALEDTCTIKLSSKVTIGVLLSSQDTNVCVVAPDEQTPGNPTPLPIPITNAGSFAVQARPDQVGKVCNVLVAPTPDTGWDSGNLTEDIVGDALKINGLVSSIPMPAPPDPFQLCVGIPDPDKPAAFVAQNVSPGNREYDATVSSSDPSVGLITLSRTPTPVPAATQTVAIPAGQSCTASDAVDFVPNGLGTTWVSATSPDATPYPTPSQWWLQKVTVTQGHITISCPSWDLGDGLQETCSVSLDAKLNGGCQNVEIKATDACRVALNATSDGFTSIIPCVSNNSPTSFSVQAREGPPTTCTLTAKASPDTVAWQGDTKTVNVVQVWTQISGLAPRVEAPAVWDQFTAYVGIKGPTGAFLAQNVRWQTGGSGMPINVCSSAPSVAEISLSLPNPTPSPAPCQVAYAPLNSSQAKVPPPPNSSQTSANIYQLAPQSIGTTNVCADPLPPVVDDPGAPNRCLQVRVDPGTITVSCSVQSIANGLQDTCTISLSATPFGGSQSFVASSSNPGACLIAPDEKTEGQPSWHLNVSGSLNFTVPAVEGKAGQTCQITAAPEATAQPPATLWTINPANVSNVPIVLRIYGLVSSIRATAASDPFEVIVGSPGSGTPAAQIPETVRPCSGCSGLPVTVCSSNTAVGQIAPSSASCVSTPCQQITIPTGKNATGNGYEFDPTGGGATTVYATVPPPWQYEVDTNKAPAQSLPVIVNKANLALPPSATVGSGLMDTFTLNAGGVVRCQDYNVTITSDPPDICLVAADETASSPGQGSVVFTFKKGNDSVPFTIHGREGKINTNTCHLTAADTTGNAFFNSDSKDYNIVQPAVRISGLATTFKAGSADDPFFVYSGITAWNSNSFQTQQKVRTGSTAPPNVQVCTSDGRVGQIITSSSPQPPDCSYVPSSAGPNLSIAPGTNSTEASAVAFRGVGNGATSVTASATGYITSDQGAVGVTTSGFALSIAPTSVPVGVGLQVPVTASRPFATEAAVDVTIWSLATNRCVVASSDLVAGQETATVTIPVWGTVSPPVWVQGIGAGTCNLEATEAAYTLYDRGSGSASVVPPGIRVSGLPSSISQNAANANFQVDVGLLTSDGSGLASLQEVRPQNACTVTVTNSNSAAAQLVLGSTPGQSVTTSILAGNTSTANGALQFDPIAQGDTTVGVAGCSATPAPPAPVAVHVGC
jgi:hypothetical protein